MDELYYKHVMVHPDLTTDPMHAQGQIGRIDNVFYGDDEIYVILPNDHYGLYEADALLVLRPAEQLLEQLRLYHKVLTQPELVGLLNIYLWQASHQDEAIRSAFQLAIGSETIRDKALMSLRDWIDNGLRDDYNYGADWQPGRGI